MYWLHGWEYTLRTAWMTGCAAWTVLVARQEWSAYEGLVARHGHTARRTRAEDLPGTDSLRPDDQLRGQSARSTGCAVRTVCGEDLRRVLARYGQSPRRTGCAVRVGDVRTTGSAARAVSARSTSGAARVVCGLSTGCAVCVPKIGRAAWAVCARRTGCAVRTVCAEDWVRAKGGLRGGLVARQEYAWKPLVPCCLSSGPCTAAVRMCMVTYACKGRRPRRGEPARGDGTARGGDRSRGDGRACG